MASLNPNNPLGLLQNLERRLHNLTEQIDTFRMMAPPDLGLLESAEENLQLAIDAFLDGELDIVETLIGMATLDLRSA